MLDLRTFVVLGCSSLQNIDLLVLFSDFISEPLDLHVVGIHLEIFLSFDVSPLGVDFVVEFISELLLSQRIEML